MDTRLMTIQDWGAVGEIVAAGGVIATLLYLAIQIRQSNVATRLGVKQSQTQLTHSLMSLSLEHSELLRKATAGAALNESELFQFKLLARGIFRGFETYCYMHDVGLLDEGEWRGIRRSIERFAAPPAMLQEYRAIRDELSPRLHPILDPLSASGPPA